MFKNVLLGIYLFIATILDFITTLHFTSFDHIAESNPFVKFLLSQSSLHFFAFKIATIIFIFTVFYLHKDEQTWAFRMTAYCCGTLWMLAGLWNTYLFFF